MQGVFPSPRREARPEDRDSKNNTSERHTRFLLFRVTHQTLAVPLDNKYQPQLALRDATALGRKQCPRVTSTKYCNRS